jgi:hypothetical protein
MDNYEAIRLAGKLAEPFDSKTFAVASGQSEPDAADQLSNLKSMSRLQSEYSATIGGPVYRLTPTSRQDLDAGSFGS